MLSHPSLACSGREKDIDRPSSLRYTCGPAAATDAAPRPAVADCEPVVLTAPERRCIAIIKSPIPPDLTEGRDVIRQDGTSAKCRFERCQAERLYKPRYTDKQRSLLNSASSSCSGNWPSSFTLVGIAGPFWIRILFHQLPISGVKHAQSAESSNFSLRPIAAQQSRPEAYGRSGVSGLSECDRLQPPCSHQVTQNSVPRPSASSTFMRTTTLAQRKPSDTR